MAPRRFIIIGNGNAGTTCAAILRREDPACQITLLTAEPYPLYNRVVLGPYLRGVLPRERVFLRGPEWHAAQRIEFLPETRAVAVNAAERTVTTAGGRVLPFDGLFIATGGRPNRLRVPGGDARFVFNFQTLDDADGILERLRESRQAVVAGGSFIAYELVEALHARGLDVTWLVRGPRWLRRLLDEEGGALVDRLVRRHGIEVVYGEEIAEAKVRDGAAAGVVTTGGRSIPCDLVGLGLGLVPNTEFLAGSGVPTNRGVVADQTLQAGVPGVCAGGDVVEFYDLVLGRHNLSGTWGFAGAHGRLAARNLLGAGDVFTGVAEHAVSLFGARMVVIGSTPEAAPGMESLSRLEGGGAGSGGGESFRRLFFLDGRLVGAVMIGDAVKAKPRYEAMIKERQKVEGPREALLEA